MRLAAPSNRMHEPVMVRNWGGIGVETGVDETGVFACGAGHILLCKDVESCCLTD